MRPQIARLRAPFCVILALFGLFLTNPTSAQPNDSTKYGLLAGITLIDHSHAPFIGGTLTHSNGFTSIATIEIRSTISAIRYNGALRLTKPARFVVSALFGPEVEEPTGDIFGPDKITYLMLSSGVALTLRTKDGFSFSLAALYMTPDNVGDQFRIVLAGKIPI